MLSKLEEKKREMLHFKRILTLKSVLVRTGNKNDYLYTQFISRKRNN